MAQILKNPFYTGAFLWNGKRYPGKHPSLIDKTLFDRAQAVAAQRNDTRATTHRFPYTGLLRCAACGCAITAEIKKDRYIYYHCTFDKGSCGGLYVRERSWSGSLTTSSGSFSSPRLCSTGCGRRCAKARSRRRRSTAALSRS